MMKGFEIKIQKSLSKEQKKIAEEVAADFVKRTIEHNMSYAKAFNTRGGHSSFLRRNCLGYTYGGLRDVGLTLRRISKNRRSFGIVKLEDLYVPDLKITADKLHECMCPFPGSSYRDTKKKRFQNPHGGGRRVIMNTHIDDWYLFAKIGKVRG